MKKLFMVLFVTAFMFIPQSGWAQMMGQGTDAGQAKMGQQQAIGQGYTGGNYCPNCGAPLRQGAPGYGGGYYPGGMMGYGGGGYPGAMGPGMMGYGGGAYPGGMMGYGGGGYPGAMGPGMMGYGGGAYPGGMMGYGGGGYPGAMGPGMMGYGAGGYPNMMPGYVQRTEPLTDKDVKSLVENHLTNFVRNPNLKVGKVKEKGEAFEVEIVTKEGSLVNRFLIDKRTGIMQPAN